MVLQRRQPGIDRGRLGAVFVHRPQGGGGPTVGGLRRGVLLARAPEQLGAQRRHGIHVPDDPGCQHAHVESPVLSRRRRSRY